MNDIRQILEMERLNNKQIRLYKFDRYWLAFERSAFNLFSIYNVNTIIKIDDESEEKLSMLIAIVENDIPAFYDRQSSVVQAFDNEMIIDCRTTCRGFLHWKESMIALFAENLDSLQNIYHLKKRMLLN